MNQIVVNGKQIQKMKVKLVLKGVKLAIGIHKNLYFHIIGLPIKRKRNNDEVQRPSKSNVDHSPYAPLIIALILDYRCKLIKKRGSRN